MCIRDRYPMSDEPLFWIHLNVDYPFHLTGILYFAKVKSNRYGKETTIFLQQRRNTGLFQEFFTFIVNVKYYICLLYTSKAFP